MGSLVNEVGELYPEPHGKETPTQTFPVDLQKHSQNSFPAKHLWVAAIEPYVFEVSTLARDSVSLMSIKASFFPSKELETRILIESTLRNHRVFHEMYVNKSSYCFGTNERSAGNKFENQHFIIFKQ